MAESRRGPGWAPVYWGLTLAMLACTGLFYFVPADNQRAHAFLHAFSFEFEQNAATTFEGFCFLLAALLAVEQAAPDWRRREAWPWLGTALLAAGLSLDELGSVHERADLLFEPIGLDTEMVALVPLAVPALLIAAASLYGFWRQGGRGRALRLALALGLLGSVVLQEKIEAHLTLPPWAASLRGVVEEGTEMLGVYVLLGLVLAKGQRLRDAWPKRAALRRLVVPAALLVAVALPALVYITEATRRMQRGRGVPASWPVFALLAVVALLAFARRRTDAGGRSVLLAMGFLGAVLAADAVIVAQRLESGRFLRSAALQDLGVPLLLLLALLIPQLRAARAWLLGALVLTPLYWAPLGRYAGFGLGAVQALVLLAALARSESASRPPAESPAG
jgi:hypothetical protein